MRIINKNVLFASKERKKISQLGSAEKLQYIWDYYKFPLVILCVFIYIAGYIIYGHLSHKDVPLYTAFVNVVSGETLTDKLSVEFLKAQNIDTSKNELYLYTNLYLTDDENNPYHEYTYASRMKILAAIDGEQLDVVLMNKEAFDAFSQSGYLCNLKELLSLDSSTPYVSVTDEYPTGIDVSNAPLIQQAGFQDTVYLGIISNSPRKEMAIEYVQYLMSE